LVLVTPLFPSASWWPTLMQLGSAVPVVMPCQRWVTTNHMGVPSWTHAWPLVVWRISGDTRYARDCRQAIRNEHYGRQIRQQIRSLMGSGPLLRHEGALFQAAIHDTVFEGVD
jgi:hypothetical protein